MKRLVTAIAILALAATAAQGKYIKKRVPLTSPPGQVVTGYNDRSDPTQSKVLVYVANGDKISVFKAGDESFVEELSVPHAYALAFDSRVGILFASAMQSGQTQLWVRSPFNGGFTEVPITNTPGDGITALAIDPLEHGSSRIYIANASDQRVDIYNGGSEIKSIPMPAKPTVITMGALARLAFVSLANGDVISISLTTEEIVSTIQAGNSLGGIVVDPYGSQRVYALDVDAVEGLDPRGTEVRRSFTVPRGTVAGAAYATTTWHGGNNHSYSGNHQIFITGPNGTSVLNGISYKVIHTFPNSAGTSVAIPPTSYNKIYVPSSTSNELIVIGGTD